MSLTCSLKIWLVPSSARSRLVEWMTDWLTDVVDLLTEYLACRLQRPENGHLYTKVGSLIDWLNISLVGWPKWIVDCMVRNDWLTCWMTDWLTDRLMSWTCCLNIWIAGWSNWLVDYLARWMAGWRVDWLTDWLVDRLTYWPTSRPTDVTELLTCWLTKWLTDCLSRWLIDLLTNQSTDRCHWVADLLADQMINWLPVSLTDRPPDWYDVIDLLSIWLAGLTNGYLAACLVKWMADLLTDWLTDWVIGRRNFWLAVFFEKLIDYVADWLIGWLTWGLVD